MIINIEPMTDPMPAEPMTTESQDLDSDAGPRADACPRADAAPGAETAPRATTGPLLSGDATHIRAQWLAEDEAARNVRVYGTPYPPTSATMPWPAQLAAEVLPPEAQWPQPPVSTRARPITVVWGLVVAAIGIMVLAVARGAVLDASALVIWVLAIAGTALIAGAVVSALRGGSRRR